MVERWFARGFVQELDVKKFFKTTDHYSTVSSMFFNASCRSRLKAHHNNVTTCGGRAKLRESVRGVSGSPFQAGFRRVFRRVRKRDTVNYVDSDSPRPLLVHSDVKACTVYAVNVVGGSRRLVRGCLFSKNSRFYIVANNGIGTARLVTTLVGRGRDFARNVGFTRDIVRKATSVLVLGRNKTVVTTHSHLNELPILVKGGTSKCYTSFRSFTCRGLNCSFRGRLNPNRVMRFATRNLTRLGPPNRRVQVYTFL